VLKAEADVTIDDETSLANVEEECQYCEEAKGYKIVGTLAPYEATEDEIIEEGIFDKKRKDTAEYRNQLQDFDIEVEKINKDGLLGIAFNLGSCIHSAVRACGTANMRKSKNISSKSQVKHSLASSAKVVLKNIEDTIKKLKKPTNFSAPAIYVRQIVNGLIGSFAAEDSTASGVVKKVDKLYDDLAKIGNIQADKKLKQDQLKYFYDQVIYRLTDVLDELKQRNELDFFLEAVVEADEEFTDDVLTEGKLLDTVKKVATRVGADAATIARSFTELGEIIGNNVRNAVKKTDDYNYSKLNDFMEYVENKAVLKALMNGNETVLNTCTKEDIEDLVNDIEEYKKEKANKNKDTGEEDLEELLDISIPVTASVTANGNNVPFMNGMTK
jgi:hypothetical protein